MVLRIGAAVRFPDFGIRIKEKGSLTENRRVVGYFQNPATIFRLLPILSPEPENASTTGPTLEPISCPKKSHHYSQHIFTKGFELIVGQPILFPTDFSVCDKGAFCVEEEEMNEWAPRAVSSFRLARLNFSNGRFPGLLASFLHSWCFQASIFSPRESFNEADNTKYFSYLEPVLAMLSDNLTLFHIDINHDLI